MLLVGARTLRLARPAPIMVRGGASSWLGLRSISGRGVGFKDVTSGSTLTWNEFFSLRVRRRRIGVLCSAASTLAATGAAFAYFGNLELDMNERYFGVEPMWIYGGAIIATGFLGYVLGPSLGNAMFNLSLGSRARAFVAKDAVFLARIRANRPDPSKQSYINPLVDYYGEKIGSLRDYRRWLRDAHLYTRKSKTFL